MANVVLLGADQDPPMTRNEVWVGKSNSPQDGEGTTSRHSCGITFYYFAERDFVVARAKRYADSNGIGEVYVIHEDHP